MKTPLKERELDIASLRSRIREASSLEIQGSLIFSLERLHAHRHDDCRYQKERQQIEARLAEQN